MLLLISIVSILFVCCVQTFHDNLQAPQVHTSLGLIEGITVTFNEFEIHAFLGIPYAKPPIGDLRFKKTVPIEAWTNTIKATEFPPPCVQYARGPLPWYDNEPGKSEDCLYLNIWVPKYASQNNKKSVFFWMYGGGFQMGSNRQPLYDGKALSAIGDIIVVTINYRLGVLGFLQTNSEEAPGNAGIFDSLEALKWVNEHIEAFGGDKERITIAGESAGAMFSGLFCVSPLTKGLFQRAIMESGAPTFLLSENQTHNLLIGQRVAESVGCATKELTIMSNPDDVVKCLRDIDAMELVKAVNSLYPYLTAVFVPSYGDELFPTNPRASIFKGQFHDVDILIGHNRDEGGYFVTTANPDVFGTYGEKDPKINTIYASLLISALYQGFVGSEKVVNYYLSSLKDDSYSIREQVFKAYGDFFHICPAIYFSEKFAAKGNNVYFYIFAHRPSTSPWAPWMDVTHFDEVQFVFGSPLKTTYNYTLIERQLSYEIIEMWSNFVKNGQPAENKLWPLYTKEYPYFLYINTSEWKSIGIGANLENCNFLRPYFENPQILDDKQITISK